MSQSIKLLFFLLVLIFVASCKQEKTFIYHKCSNSIEANIDILRSVNSNKDYLNKNRIQIIEDDNNCGFTLISGNKRKFINGSLTDIELMLEIKSFYQIEG